LRNRHRELEGSMARASQFEPSAGSLSLEKMVGGVAGANSFARNNSLHANKFAPARAARRIEKK